MSDMLSERPRRGQLTLWPRPGMRLDEAIELVAESLRNYGVRYDTWAIAWSGGKDSTALVTMVLYLMASGRVPRPRRLIVFYADTRMESTPLWLVAADIRRQLAERGVEVHVVMAPLDERFLVYMLGRGVVPPNNGTMRWCTRLIKVKPMQAALHRIAANGDGKVLMLTGVRQGESAIRDGRIAMSCGKDGAECGQGWYQETLPGSLCDTLAALLHLRVCHVWDWLNFLAPTAEYGGWSTRLLAEVYGGDEATEINARTGCLGCNLIEDENDRAQAVILSKPAWAHLAPIRRVRPIWRELRRPERRLRMPGGEMTRGGDLAKKQGRMGPLTMEARLWALGELLAIQAEINETALALSRPGVDFLNAEEESRIRDLIAANTWPDGWTGLESLASEPHDVFYDDGAVQPRLW